MAYISSDSSDDEDYVNLPQTSYREKREYDKSIDQERSNQKTEFEDKRYRYKDDMEREGSLRRRIRDYEKLATKEFVTSFPEQRRERGIEFDTRRVRRAETLERDGDPLDMDEINRQHLKDLIEREISNRLVNQMNTNDRKQSRNKPNKSETLSEEELIEQKVQKRLAEAREQEEKLKEKKRKEEEKERLLKEISNSKNEMIEMEKRLARMFQEGIQQQKQQFDREKLSLVDKIKQTATLVNQQSKLEKQSNRQNDNTNDFDDNIPSYSGLKTNANRAEVDFSRAKGGEYQILLLGGSGTGKSTLINTMANYFLGGSLKNPKVVIPTKYFKSTVSGYNSQHSESALDDVTKSKTTKCLTYTFTHPNNRSLKFVFIDSPGLSDTGGTKQDDKNIDEIINTAINAGSLSAIIVIANGTEPRVTPSIRNTLVRLANNLPDELIDNNLLLVLTKCFKLSASFDEKVFEHEISKPRELFYMDNLAFCSDPKIWQSDPQSYNELQFKWKQSHEIFDNLLKCITRMSNTSTESFKSMKDLRNKLKSEIAIICQEIANIQKVQDSLEAAQIAAQRTGDKKDQFSNYTTTETITLKKIVPASYHSTVCTTHFLNDIICHEGCGLEFTKNSGGDFFSSCYCMDSNDICNQCGCGPTSHYHDMVELKTVTETIDKVLEDIKAQYDSAFADYEKFSSDSDTFQSTLDNLQSAVDQKYLMIHQLCYDLKKICSRFNFVDELHANIQNMELEARMIKNADVRKNAEIEIDKLIKLANDLSTNQSYSKGSNYNSSASNSSNFQNIYPPDSQNSGQNWYGKSAQKIKGLFK